MYTSLAREAIRSGETLEIGVVESPDAEWAPQIIPFLGHKGPPWREHIRRALEGRLDDLRTLFYVGCIDGRVVTQVMIVAARGTGILGHVYTLPEHRRKGAYTALMPHQMADMPRIGVRVLTLGTGYDSHPYWIYHANGFRSIAPGRGEMIWRSTPVAEAQLFAPGPATVRPARWDDWPWFNLLGMQPVAAKERLPRTAVMSLKGQGNLEGAFAPFQLERERDPRRQAVVLETGAGATVGFALLAPDPRWFGDACAADAYTHPDFRTGAADLLRALEWPDAPCVAYRAPAGGGGDDAAAWEAAGFRMAATLPRWFSFEDQRRDMELWVRV
jgi:GNAT superfamily N-acetyltransferase